MVKYACKRKNSKFACNKSGLCERDAVTVYKIIHMSYNTTIYNTGIYNTIFICAIEHL